MLRLHVNVHDRIAQVEAGAALGGKGGAHLLAHLVMPASADTVLRLIRRPPPPEYGTPRAVGIDDWTARQGEDCGTIVVDLERRRVLNLLPDCTAEMLADWLRARPSAEVVAGRRDLHQRLAPDRWKVEQLGRIISRRGCGMASRRERIGFDAPAAKTHQWPW